MSRLGTREAPSWLTTSIGMINDRLSVSRASGVAFGVRLTPAGEALHSLASPTLAVDRKVEPRPSRAMSVAAVRAGPRPGASPLSPVPRTKRARRRERRGRVTADVYCSTYAKEKG